MAVLLVDLQVCHLEEGSENHFYSGNVFIVSVSCKIQRFSHPLEKTPPNQLWAVSVLLQLPQKGPGKDKEED